MMARALLRIRTAGAVAELLRRRLIVRVTKISIDDPYLADAKSLPSRRAFRRDLKNATFEGYSRFREARRPQYLIAPHHFAPMINTELGDAVIEFVRTHEFWAALTFSVKTDLPSKN
jgi:hypothetical protein